SGSVHLDMYHRVVMALHTMPKPTVAAIRGVAAGISCNIALAADMRIIADNACFIEAFARIGLVPDGGGAYFLPRLVGMGKALELAMLAEEVNAEEAMRLGLANKCVPVAEFESATQAFAQRLAHGPTQSYTLIKQLMHASYESDLQTILKLEGEKQGQAMQTADHAEGVTAFMQKRPANYSGR
ncbi:MAG: enoyl-CoA hydratase-related protein, partial [Chloroflexota bacterium]|nr:enoyl-CoA hydratase-related protein [Chloroflexota bacterium]